MRTSSTKYGATDSLLRRLTADLDRLPHRGVRHRLRDVALFGHPLQHVVPPARGAAHVHVRALALWRLDDAGDRRGLLQREVLRSLVEVHARRRFHAVGPVAEVDLVAVEREDLALGVAPLDLDGEQRLLDLALPGLLVGEEQLAGELLRQRARPGEPSLDDVLGRGDDDTRDADAEVAIETCILGREDGLVEARRDVVELDDDAPLRRELADDLSVRGIDAGDRVRSVVVERRNPGQVTGIGEHDPGDDSEDGGDGKQRDQPGTPGDADD